MTRFASAGQDAAHHDPTEYLAGLHAALEQARDFRIHQLQELAAPDPIGRLANPRDPRRQVASAMRIAAAAALSDINAALDRVRHGRYGRCERCDTAIALERLQILPAVRLCMRCQHAKEHPRAHARVTAHAPQAACGAGDERLQPNRL